MSIFDNGLRIPGFSEPAKKRKVFFSFHYADIMRVNNVRMCGEFKQGNADTQNNSSQRSIEGFYDFSLWESRKLDGPDALKRMIREGVENTSAVCVLIGAQTYLRPWVRYEIARSVIDGRGLLAVHLNNLNHHVDRRPHPLGPNPLDYMGIYNVQQNALATPSYRLAEISQSGQWVAYGKYIQEVTKPRYLSAPNGNQVMPLSRGTQVFDFIGHGGHDAIGTWIDQAAQAVGRALSR